MNRREFAGFLGLAGAGAAATALASPAIAQQATSSTFDKVRSSKKLRVAGIVGTEPYYHKDIATGEWTAFV